MSTCMHDRFSEMRQFLVFRRPTKNFGRPACIQPDAPPRRASHPTRPLHVHPTRRAPLRPLLPRAATGRQPGAVECKISRIIYASDCMYFYIYVYLYKCIHTHSLYIYVYMYAKTGLKKSETSFETHVYFDLDIYNTISLICHAHAGMVSCNVYIYIYIFF